MANATGARAGGAFGLDVTRVLVAPVETVCRARHALLASEQVHHADADTLRSLGEHDIGRVAYEAVANGETSCYLLYRGQRVIAYDFIAYGHVAARHNAGGMGFHGIGLDLPGDTAYVFKAWVDPCIRASGVHRRLLTHVADELQGAGIRWLVTTADWSNQASLRSFALLGFEPRAWAAELVLGPWRHYRLPAGVSLDGERNEGGEVRLIASHAIGRRSS